MRKISSKKVLLLALLLILVLGTAGYFFQKDQLAANDCTSVEKYDVVTGSCYYDCETDAQCAEKARQVDAELSAFFEGSQTKIDKNDDHAKTKVAQQDSEQPVEIVDAAYTGTGTGGTIYTVTPDLKLQPKPRQTHQRLWNLFVGVAGKTDAKKYVHSFEVFDDSGNDTAASVWQSKTPGKWHVNVNAAYQDDKKDLIHTMVHEYGHIVSLNQTQVAQVEGACPRLTISEGCVNDTAYIKIFKDTFWGQYGDAVPVNEGENTDEVSQFYDENKDNFASQYAATNYIEDFAESWAVFVTKSRPNSDLEKDQKVNFFYEYPELTQIRDRIRANIASSL